MWRYAKSHSLILPFWAFICLDLYVTSTIYSHKKLLRNFIFQQFKILFLYLLVHIQIRSVGKMILNVVYKLAALI